METAESVRIFTTCPPQGGVRGDEYRERVREVARWSDEAGCAGILVYTDNGLVDPWLVSQIIVESTRTLSPLVAIQPIYMHPYSVAKMVSTLGWLYGRRISLNMVAGGFRNDLIALNDQTPHDRRYDRLVEYTTIVQQLLASDAPVTFSGEFYRVERLAMKPALPAQLAPLITISGSSAAGIEAARRLGAIAVKYPEPPEQCSVEEEDKNRGCGVRVGIIAREDEDDAWRIAEERFPPDRAGQVTHAVAMKTSDSVWHRTLSDLGGSLKGSRSTYWLVPFENYKTFCPYLVGTYEQVAAQVKRYIVSGYRTFILDIPASREELEHIGIVFGRAQESAFAKQAGQPAGRG